MAANSCPNSLSAIPAAEDVGKVLDVVGDQDAPLARREVEQAGVVETLQLRVLIQGAHAVETIIEALGRPKADRLRLHADRMLRSKQCQHAGTVMV
jgi:hypothetical protein